MDLESHSEYETARNQLLVHSTSQVKMSHQEEPANKLGQGTSK